MHKENVHESEENGGDYIVDCLDEDEVRCECGCERVGKADETTTCDICDRPVVLSCLKSNWKDTDMDVCSSCRDIDPIAVLLAQREQLRRDRAWAVRAIRDFDLQDRKQAVTDYAARLGHAIGTIDYVKQIMGGK